jgi:hypothetical protein
MKDVFGDRQMAGKIHNENELTIICHVLTGARVRHMARLGFKLIGISAYWDGRQVEALFERKKKYEALYCATCTNRTSGSDLCGECVAKGRRV